MGEDTSAVGGFLLQHIAEGGRVELQVIRQASGLYCSVRGMGVEAGGYSTIEEALDAWRGAIEDRGYVRPHGE